MESEKKKFRKLEQTNGKLADQIKLLNKKKDVKLEELTARAVAEKPSDGKCQKCQAYLIVCGQYAEKLKALKKKL